MARENPPVWLAQLRRLRDFVEAVEAEVAGHVPPLRFLRRFLLLIYLVVRGFIRNRCPSRAAGLSYTTLLALVPLLAVALSVSKNFLHESTAALVPRLLDRAVALVAPQLEYLPADDDFVGPPTPGGLVISSHARQQVVDKIQGFLGNIDAGRLGTIGTVSLVLVAILLLRDIENAFNDIWGVEQGRSLLRQVVYYWSVITLGPLLLAAAVALSHRLDWTPGAWQADWLARARLLLAVLVPYLIAWIGFSVLYAVLPNTHVGWRAALAGGLVGGTLFQLNGKLGALYVSRVVSYSKIYGGLGVLPVVLVGLYFSWLIVLLGAQVAFAAQNIRAYLQQRASERIDQLGREWIACRLLVAVTRGFLRDGSAARVEDLAGNLRVPLQTLNQVAAHLVHGGLLARVAGGDGGLQPARDPGQVRLADVLQLMRSHADGPTLALSTDAETDSLRQRLESLQVAAAGAPGNLTLRELAEQADADAPSA